MSFPWIPCSELTGPNWNLSLHEVFEFVVTGWLTPYDENKEIMLPKKFIQVQYRAGSVMYPYGRSFDEARICVERVLDNKRKMCIDREIYCPSGLTAEEKAKFEQVQTERLEDNLAEIDKEKTRRLAELVELEKFLAEHSESPWQSLEFSGLDYEIESVRIAKAYFKESEVNALEIAIKVAKAGTRLQASKPIGFKTGWLTDDTIKRAKELKPIVEKLYELTMKEHRPLKVYTAENCLETALAIFDDKPEDYAPIDKADLSPDLFSMHPSHNRRDFVGRLLQILLKKEGITVTDYQALYDEICKNT